MLKLGDHEIVYNDDFKLIIQTKLSNPHYQPEVQAECTVINFAVTQDGLEEHLFSGLKIVLNFNAFWVRFLTILAPSGEGQKLSWTPLYWVGKLIFWRMIFW